MAISTGGGGHRRLMSEINVTPLVDVMLVMLIIFMVTAPMLQEGMSVNVPEVKAGPLEQHEQEPVILVVDKNGGLSIKRTAVPMEQLSKQLQEIFAERADKTLYLRADKDVSYGVVVQTMALAKQAGATKLSMITQPPQEK
ncbi:MAG: ExbD/TolR family protein [Candidatus Lernaella stagnicola]|nr:ExbD/TolR family protein [Candidatus Lernaella stagnicola]